MQLDFSVRRRRRRWWLVPPVVLALWFGLPRLAALCPAAAEQAGRILCAPYAAQLDTLRQENFTLHRRLAESADALAENAALRRLLDSERAVGSVLTARVVARQADGFVLACPGAAPGAAVLDAGGRYAGVVVSVQGDTCTVAFGTVAGLCGDCAGLVTPGRWVLYGLPADSAPAAGEIVTTPGGDWLGVLAASPAADVDGLTASAKLTDTADLWDSVYFVKATPHNSRRTT